MSIKRIKKVLILEILIIAVIFAMYLMVRCQNRDAFTYKGDYKGLSLEGTWFKVQLDTISRIEMTDDGRYVEKDGNDKIIKKGSYEIGNHALKWDSKIYKMNYVDEAEELEDIIDEDDLSSYDLRRYFYIINDESEKVFFFDNEAEALEQIESNCFTNEYYEKVGMIDENGFAIDGNDNLVAYTGDQREITIPEGVILIAENAMSADYNRARHTDMVVIPKTVKIIDSWAFAFSNVKKVVIAQGVETIKTMAFCDSSIEEIHFPQSVPNLEKDFLDNDAEYDGLKIYCYKNSNVDYYFKENPPKGDYKIIYEN